MLMINEYGSAIKRAHSEEEIQDLLASGWKPYEPKKESAPAPVQPAPTEPIAAPQIVERKKNPLMYEDRYLSDWAKNGTHAQLKKIFDDKGIEYSSRTSKSDMQKRLRQYIREVKVQEREERQHDGN